MLLCYRDRYATRAEALHALAQAWRSLRQQGLIHPHLVVPLPINIPAAAGGAGAASNAAPQANPAAAGPVLQHHQQQQQ